MCDAVLAITAITALVGTAAKASSDSQAAGAQAEAARRNALMARFQAADAQARGEQAAGAVQAEGTRTIGRARVAQAASGVAVGTGSALDALEDTRLMTELDAERIRNNAAREAWGLRTQSRRLDESALLSRSNGRAAVAGSLLSGAGQVAMGYGRYVGQQNINARAAAGQGSASGLPTGPGPWSGGYISGGG